MEIPSDCEAFEELDDVLHNSSNEWKMTLDLYVKFQMRRSATATAGKEPLKKNLIKLMTAQEIRPTNECIDPIITGSENYIRYHMGRTEEYVVFEENIRSKVLCNASAIFAEVKTTYIENSN